MRALLDDRGRGEPAMLMVGGGLTGWLSWERVQAQLAAERRVLRAQLVGVQAGLDGTPLPAGYSVRLESRAIGAALDAAAPGPPVDLVGWSYGGLVSLDLALERPERVRTLTLIEPPAVWVLEATGRSDDRARAEIAELRALHERMREDVTEAQLVEFARAVALLPPGADAAAIPGWPVWLQHRRSLRGGFAVFAHADRAQRLREFDRPTLLVKGTGSAHFLHRIVDALADTLPHAQVAEWSGGHAPHLANPDAFVGRLRALTAAAR